MSRTLVVVVAMGLLGGRGWAAELAPSELALKELLGPATPDPVRLWPDKPPGFLENAPPETCDEHARIRMISVPTISVYLATESTSTGMAVIVCPGGGYGGMDWRTHVVYAAQVFNPLGVAVIGLKYRTRPPHMLDNEGIREIALLDAKRAMRTARHRAAEWHLDPRRIGMVGYSAGANLAMNLAANFDAGDPRASDPVERQSSRPDFVVGCGTWHWRKKESPFQFSKNSPPVFMLHAVTDMPIELVQTIQGDLEKLGVPVRLEMFAEGGHGVGNLIPTRVLHGFPPAQWPKRFLEWYRGLPPGPDVR